MDGSSTRPSSRTKSEMNDPNSEVARGGADAVGGTSGISEQGTAPPPDLEVVAPTRSAGGNRLVWLAVVVVLGLIFAYAAGMLR